MGHWRIHLTLALIFLFAAAIVGRLFFLQIIHHDFYAAMAKGQQKFFVSSQGERGEIFFQNHDLPIATNEIYKLVYVSPAEIPSEEKESLALKLSQVLNLGYDFILEKLKEDNLYELLKNRLSDSEFEALKKMNLVGVYFGEEGLRNYPYQNFASNLLGFVNKDSEGQYGIEEYWNNILAGKEHFLEGEGGPLGYFLDSQADSENKGSDLILTIDYNLQYQAEKLLEKAYNQLNIEGGTIIAIEPHTGKILALAEFPSFNPNKYSEEKDFKIFQIDAIQKIFEPGSVFKPITMAAALNEGVITPYTTYIDPGVIKIGGWPIYNYDQRVYPGQISMTEVLEKSINTGAVFAESQLGHENFLRYITRFGIFEITGIDLRGETLPPNEEFKQGREINFATASYGQGIEITPIQLARAFCAIANGGKLVKPYLVEKIKNNDNKIIETQPEIIREVISPNTASKLTAMLVSVVENGPYTKGARIPGYYVAGKTGTAQMSFAALGVDKEGYSEKTWQSFIGFAPAFDPKFLIMVKLDNPATKTAEYSAVPIFKELAKYIIDYWQIPPDYEL